MSVTLSILTIDERNDLSSRFGVVWNTSDNFDSDVTEYHQIMQTHRDMNFPHWYMPHHPQLRLMAYESEEHAFAMAALIASQPK